MSRFIIITCSRILIITIFLGGWRISAVSASKVFDSGPNPVEGSDSEKYESEVYDEWHLPVAKTSVEPQAAPIKDHFGYQLVTNQAFNWIDAQSGTEVLKKGQEDRDDNYTEAIDIGFDFRFYEKTYNQLFIGTNGFVTFEEGSESFANRSIPEDTPPNNIIAALWDDLDIGSKASSPGKVFYQQRDGPSGRSFVIEWFRVVRYNTDDLLTFEIILYENGDIILQYLTLNGVLNDQTVGIEDCDGVDGLLYLYNSAGLTSNKAIRFLRPDPAPRVKVLPLFQSSFVKGGEVTFNVWVRNTNQTGTDVIDLSATLSKPNWKLNFYAANGTTPLSDSDGDGKVDTDSLGAGRTERVVVKVEAPDSVDIGDYAEIDLKAISSDDTSKNAVMRMQAAVPADFAQAYADSQTGIYLNLTWKAYSLLVKATDFFTGNTISLTDTKTGGYVYGWERNGEKTEGTQTSYFSDIEYIVLNGFGGEVQPLERLSNNENLASPLLLVHARYPALADAPDGKVGVVWAQYKLDLTTSRTNSNIFFAILDVNGRVTFGPVNVTKNDGWRGEGVQDVPVFNSPRVVATGDNRFFLTWIDAREKTQGETSSVYYTVYSSNGDIVKDASAFAQSNPGNTLFIDPAIADLSGNRVLMAYSIYDQLAKTYSVAYATLNSGGNILRNSTIIPDSSGWRLDAVQFENGNILLAWTDPTTEKITRAVLNNNGTDLVKEPSGFPLVGVRKPDYVSVTTTQNGYALLTWMDAEWKDYLYYALVDSTGSAVTPPMIFVTGQASNPLIQTSFTGQGVTTFEGKFLTFMPAVLQR